MWWEINTQRVSSFGHKQFGRIARVKGIEVLMRLRSTPSMKQGVNRLKETCALLVLRIRHLWVKKWPHGILF